ncbi:sensor histidine kinase [Flagellimonas amoyensis]|uniref:sensor histidine kinase n=1 Tax=Flagellimonas amoyensis TaxID=2169401 RepID=UPI00131F398A|nr:histidine kinase [Allomuricauda amoyensis]
MAQNGPHIPFKVFKSENDSTTFDQIFKGRAFKYPKSSEEANHKSTYWLQLDFRDKIPPLYKDSVFYLKFNSFDFGELYFWDKDHVSKRPIGLFDDKTQGTEIPLTNYYSEAPIDQNSLIDQRYLYIRAKRITFSEKLQNWSFTLLASSSVKKLDLDDLKSLWPFYAFAGGCLIIWLSTISFYFYLRKLEFLFYSIYIILLFLYVSGDILSLYDHIFSGNRLLHHWFSQGSLLLANFAYGMFFIYYLRTKKDYPKIHSLMYVIMGSIFLPIVVIIVFYFMDYMAGLNYMISSFTHMILGLSILGLIYLGFHAKNVLAYFVIAASFSFIVSYVLHIYFADPEDGLLLNSRYYLLIGCSFEIIIFTIGLNYKVHLEFRENTLLQQKALDEKNKALRAQINPHFIFNALNSIQNLIIKNDIKSSLKYLSRFSHLARNILESSIQPNATIDAEIAMLKDYLELESLRFDNSFSYEIHVDEGLDTSSIEIPYMTLQPFVENSLIHGLLPKIDGERKLTISFKKKNNVLLCLVDDNGIGRKASENLDKSSFREKKSRGMEVTSLRLNALGGKAKGYQIIDKTDHNGEPSGTTVIIELCL